ncbi:MAG: diacylglycerol kinase [Actinomycetota bacterium]|nr:diacylglycerol kinase [Actinomycetota bacterium]
MALTSLADPTPRTVEGHVLVVANPAAAGVSGPMLDEIAARLGDRGARVTVAWTTRAGDAVDLAADSAADGEVGLIVAVGGDGTVREVAQGLLDVPQSQSPVVLALPAGSGNSTARSCWGPRGWQAALDAALDQRRSCVRAIDLLRLVEPDVVSVLGASSGFLANVLIGAADVVGLQGLDRYHAAAAAVLAALPADPTVVRVDGVVIHDGPACLATVGGGRHRAQLYQFLPRSVLDDGQADVCVIAAVDHAARDEIAALVLTGDHLAHPAVRYARGRRVTIERSDGRPLVAEYDGDLWLRPGPTMTIDVLAGALALLASIEPPDAEAVSLPDDNGSALS